MSTYNVGWLRDEENQIFIPFTYTKSVRLNDNGNTLNETVDMVNTHDTTISDIISGSQIVGKASLANATKGKLMIGRGTGTDTSFDGSKDVRITAKDLGLTGALVYQGISTTAITDGGTENPTINGSEVSTNDIQAGGIVLYKKSNSPIYQEYVWTGSAWELLGDEGSYALKTISIDAGDGLAIDGNNTLAADIGISVATDGLTVTIANKKIALATSGVTKGSYGPSANITDLKPTDGTNKFTIPSITVDEYGRVTAASTKTITLATDSTLSGEIENLTAVQIEAGNGLSGGGALGDGKIALAAKVNRGLDITEDTIGHTNSITEGTISGSSGAVAFEGTFTIPSITYDAQGHITKTETTTVTMPSVDDINEGIADNASEIGKLKTRMSTAEGEIDTLQANSATKTELNNLALEVESNDGDIQSLFDQDNAMSTEISTINSNINNIIHNIEGNLENNDTDWDWKVTPRLVDLESRTKFMNASSETDTFYIVDIEGDVGFQVDGTGATSLDFTTATGVSLENLNATVNEQGDAIGDNAEAIEDIKTNYKPKQTALTANPAANGSAITFISSVLQDTNGVVTTARKTVRNASAEQSGLMSKEHFNKLENIDDSAKNVSFTASLTSGTKIGTITINETGTDLYAPTNTVSGALNDGKTAYIVTLTPSSGTSSSATISAMAGATTSAAGNAGLVPKPVAGDQAKFLMGNGTWATPTDNKVTQTLASSSTNKKLPILTCVSDSPTSGDAAKTFYNTDVTLNPSTGAIAANKFIGNLNGNADSATQLETARKINGTDFDGTEDVTTNQWGIYRRINITDGTNNSVAIAVNGGNETKTDLTNITTAGAISLNLPSTIKAALDGNAATATKLKTARALKIGNTSKDFNGSAGLTWTHAEIGYADSSSGLLSAAAQTIAGNKTFTNALTVNGVFSAKAAFEIYGATPYIDFHFNNSTSDYTSRIIESASGTLTVNGTTVVKGGAVTTPANIYCGNNLYAAGNLYMHENALTKGTAPSTATYASIMVLDSAKSTESREGMLQFAVTTSGSTTAGLYAYKWEAGSSDYARLLITEYADGTNKITTNSKIYGAVWNDYAEYRQYKDGEKIPFGRVVVENGDDTLSLASKRLQKGSNVCSDTFGFAIGETENTKMPIAVAGRALVYTNEDRNSYNPGDAVCSGPNGTVSKMSREEIKEYPDCIIGYVSAIPEYETWGEWNVTVDGRIWIKVV